MTIRYLQNPANSADVRGLDDSIPSDVAFINALKAQKFVDITGSWPPAPPASVPLNQQALAALPETDRVCLRCYKAGVVFPAAWQTYTTGLRAIANGTDTTSTSLPAKPAYPAGT